MLYTQASINYTSATIKSSRKAIGRCKDEKHCIEYAHRCCRRKAQNQHQKKVWCQTVILLVQLYSHYSIGYCCKLFGKSRQAFYEQKNNDNDAGLQDALVLKLVAEIRADLPRCGTDKLHFMLQEKFAQHSIKLGRDGLYFLLGKYGLLVRHRKRKPYTTNSYHHYKKYPNLIKEMILTQAGILWVSDIT